MGCCRVCVQLAVAVLLAAPTDVPAVLCRLRVTGVPHFIISAGDGSGSKQYVLSGMWVGRVDGFDRRVSHNGLCSGWHCQLFFPLPACLPTAGAQPPEAFREAIQLALSEAAAAATGSGGAAGSGGGSKGACTREGCD